MDNNLPSKIERAPDGLPTAPAARKSRFRWLIAPEKKGFLLPLTGFWILGMDWILFSEELLSFGLAIPLLVVIGFILGSIGTFIFQKRFAGDTAFMAGLKAILAGLVVGVPWPMTGTVVGAWILFLAGIQSREKPPRQD
jgi:hypothetical protein